ncbi:hypothetical protein ABK040_010652 [Willaertia magna]
MEHFELTTPVRELLLHNTIESIREEQIEMEIEKEFESSLVDSLDSTAATCCKLGETGMFLLFVSFIKNVFSMIYSKLTV